VAPHTTALRAYLGEKEYAVWDRMDRRGMNMSHSFHDWLGGYPYETASAEQVTTVLTKLGFGAERLLVQPFTTGVFGSSCNEYVYRKIAM